MRGQRLLRQLMRENFIGMEDLKGHGRWKEIVASRVAVYRGLHAAGMSYSEIGRLCGRDHTSILYWLKKGRRERRLPYMQANTNRRRAHLAACKQAVDMAA